MATSSSTARARGGSLVGVKSHVHYQKSAETTWTVNHNFGFQPSVTVLKSGSVEVVCDVVHVSMNQVVVSFSVSTEGLAICL